MRCGIAAASGSNPNINILSELRGHRRTVWILALHVRLGLAFGGHVELTQGDAAIGDTPRVGRSVSLDHAAELLGVSRRTIYNRIREGRLQTVRTLGGSQRVLLESVEEHRERDLMAGEKPDRAMDRR
jgi:excisionase family DNA binding protein